MLLVLILQVFVYLNVHKDYGIILNYVLNVWINVLIVKMIHTVMLVLISSLYIYLKDFVLIIVQLKDNIQIMVNVVNVILYVENVMMDIISLVQIVIIQNYYLLIKN
jgi:hypothetical protein